MLIGYAQLNDLEIPNDNEKLGLAFYSGEIVVMGLKVSLNFTLADRNAAAPWYPNVVNFEPGEDYDLTAAGFAEECRLDTGIPVIKISIDSPVFSQEMLLFALPLEFEKEGNVVEDSALREWKHWDLHWFRNNVLPDATFLDHFVDSHPTTCAD